MKTIVYLSILLAIVIIALLTSPAFSSRAPYGGCDEAWQAPQSAGAQWCRDQGWHITPKIVVGPKGWVRYSAVQSFRPSR